MTTQIKTSQLADISRLLFSAWCAEYALRLKPLAMDADYLNQSLKWYFPQAYYAAHFSARAVMTLDNLLIINPAEIEAHLSNWAVAGYYGPGFTRLNNPFQELMKYRLTEEPPLYSGPEVAALYVKLTSLVHAISLVHETYIIKRLGHEVYQPIIDNLPDYLRDGHVGARATFLMSDY